MPHGNVDGFCLAVAPNYMSRKDLGELPSSVDILRTEYETPAVRRLGHK
jgi:hypothetical protein